MSETKKQPTYNPNSLLSDPNLPDHAKTSTSSTSSGAQTTASPEKKSAKTTTSASTATTANSANSAKSNPNSDKPITNSAATVSNSANATGSTAAATANSTTGSAKTQPAAFRSDAAHRATTQNQNFFAEQNAKAKAKKDQRAKATKRSLIIIAIIVALLLISLTTWFVVVKISNSEPPTMGGKPYDEMTEEEKIDYNNKLNDDLYNAALGISSTDNDSTDDADSNQEDGDSNNNSGANNSGDSNNNNSNNNSQNGGNGTNNGSNNNNGNTNNKPNSNNTGNNNGGKIPSPEEADKIFDDALDKTKNETEKDVIRVSEMSYQLIQGNYDKIIDLGKTNTTGDMTICDNTNLDIYTRARCYNFIILAYSYKGQEDLANIYRDRVEPLNTAIGKLEGILDK